MKSIIKLTIIILILGFFAIAVEHAGCQGPTKETSKPKNAEKTAELPPNVFKVGERVKFGVYSAGIKVGSGELSYKGVVDFGKNKVQEVNFKVSTFSVNDSDTVFGTLDFSNPVHVERKIRLFGKDEMISEDYSNDRKSVTISKRVDEGEPEIQKITVDDELTNVLLLLFKLRNDSELKIGKAYKITLPTQNFELFVKDNRRLKTQLGVFDTFYFESNPPKYRIWLKNDHNRLPLRIQGLVAGGMLYLVATEVSPK